MGKKIDRTVLSCEVEKFITFKQFDMIYSYFFPAVFILNLMCTVLIHLLFNFRFDRHIASNVNSQKDST